MLRHTIGLIAIAGLAAAAQADVLFSFASDTDHTSYTFTGFGGGVSDAQDPGDPIELLIDDANGNNVPLTYDVEFQADFSIAYAGSVNVGGGLFVHTYALNGDFGFYDLSGNAVLTATVSGGALTALGGQNNWLSTSTILSADGEGADITYTWHLADNKPYGLFNGDSVGPHDDGSFTLTFLQSGGGSGVALDANMLPADEWVSEGSYSGSATFVPTPGSLVLLSGAGLVLGLRRR